MDGAGQIPLTAIRAYCIDFEMEPHEADMFKRIIMTLDNRRAVLIARKRKASEAKPKL